MLSSGSKRPRPCSSRNHRGTARSLGLMRSVWAALALAVLASAAPAAAVDLPSIPPDGTGVSQSRWSLQAMFRAALLNTGEQAVLATDGTAYVKTGDIPAEWLRDASAQVRPYLFFAKRDPAVASLVRGIIAREGAVPRR